MTGSPIERPGIPAFADLGDLRFSAAVQERYRTVAELHTLIRRTVSPSRLVLDAGLIGATVLLSVLTVEMGTPAPSAVAILLVVGYAAPRLLSARRAASVYAEIADEPTTALNPQEKEKLPLPLHSPLDARTLSELARMLRPSTSIVSLRATSVIFLGFWGVLLSVLIVIAVSFATGGGEIVRVGAAQVLIAALVPHVAFSFLAWAIQRHIDAIFDQAHQAMATGTLPPGNLDDGAAIRILADGSASIDQKRLMRAFRPRRGTARRPPVLPIVTFGMSVVLGIVAIVTAL